MKYLASLPLSLAGALALFAASGCSTSNRDFSPAGSGGGSPDSSVGGSGGSSGTVIAGTGGTAGTGGSGTAGTGGAGGVLEGGSGAAGTGGAGGTGGTGGTALARGTACAADAQCASTHCVDGVCCDTACTEPCKACDIAGSPGTCAQVVSGQPHGNRAHCAGEGIAPCGGACAAASAACTYPTIQCRAPSCTNGSQTQAATCTAGACPPATTTPCSPYACGPTACIGSCAGDGDCTPATPFCNGSTCKATKPNGRTCGAPSECTSNICVDGYCCNSACTADCQACDIQGSLGTCAQVTTGQPHGVRNACVGSGACAGYCAGGNTGCTFPTSPCRSANCGGNVETYAANCSGGSCPAASTHACSPYLCNAGATACRTSCAADGDCQPAAPFCVSSGTCQTTAANGHACPCAADGTCAKCASGYCTEGFCCNQSYCGDCGTCAKTGSQGTCTPLPRRTACGNTLLSQICDGTTLTCTLPTLPCGTSPNTCPAFQYCYFNQPACTYDVSNTSGEARCAKQDDCPSTQFCCYVSNPGGSGVFCTDQCYDGGGYTNARVCASNADCTQSGYPYCSAYVDANSGFNRYRYCSMFP
jgi:hypothetical protein